MIVVAMADASLQLINVEGGGYFEFQFFPAVVSLDDRANWERQDLTHGEKPLFYANRDPRVITFPELYLDTTTVQGEPSLRPQIEAIKTLMDEINGLGRPPKLLAAWGDWSELCVLEEFTTKEIFHNKFGHPTRVEIRITVVKIQNG
ncbi:MAG: hypothetical protein M3209_00165 [Acidobacteriota bacterium]|nr:hypothetical protein [Acidobacteriota bacterium]